MSIQHRCVTTGVQQINCKLVSIKATVKFIYQFIISSTSAFIFTSPSSDKLRNFSATLVLTERSAVTRSSKWLQRCSGLGCRLETYFSRHDNRPFCRVMTFCRSTTPAASATQNKPTSRQILSYLASAFIAIWSNQFTASSSSRLYKYATRYC